MADESEASPLLIVTGSLLRAEEADRPIAYYLRQQVEAKLVELCAPGPPRLRPCVVADFRWLHDDPLQVLPTISIGGPGVNALAQKWLDEVPMSLIVQDRYFIQMHPEFDEPRVSIWGMDNPDTQVAVGAFVQRFLPRFLEHCLMAESEGLFEIALDDDDDDDDDDDEDEGEDEEDEGTGLDG